MNGNMGFVDSFGFLHPIVNDFSELEELNIKRDERIKQHIEKEYTSADPLFSLKYKYRYKGEPLMTYLRPEIPMNKNKYTNVTVNREIESLKSNVNCWICEGWKEQKITWIIGDSGIYVTEPVYLHLDID